MAGAIVHRESQSFDRKQAANAWIVKREAELKAPGGLEQKEDPPLSAVIDRYIAESTNVVMGTKAQVLKAIKNSDLGETKCSEITSHTIVSFARDLNRSADSNFGWLIAENEFGKCASLLLQDTIAFGSPAAMKASYLLCRKESRNPDLAMRYHVLDADFIRALGIEVDRPQVRKHVPFYDLTL